MTLTSTTVEVLRWRHDLLTLTVRNRIHERSRLGRLATIQPNDTPQVSPVGFTYNEELGTIDIAGYNISKSQKFRNIAVNDKVALVVDDITSRNPWRLRCPGRGHSGKLHVGVADLRCPRDHAFTNRCDAHVGSGLLCSSQGGRSIAESGSPFSARVGVRRQVSDESSASGRVRRAPRRHPRESNAWGKSHGDHAVVR
jgi:PPOX class F420-dependent enzyme/OxyR family protein